MKKLAIALCFAITFAVPVFGQVNPCSYTTQLTGGTTVEVTTDWQKTGSVPNTEYEYYLWHNKNDNTNKVTMKYYGANQGGGAAFRGEWNEPNTKFDYLARIGLQFEKNGSGSGKLYTEYDDIFADYSYERSGRLNGQNYSYIGIYGWARAGNGANLVEYYIVDDWWGNQSQSDATPVGTATTGGSVVATATIDGTTYNIVKNSRTGQPSIEGDNTNFDQYFSIRQTTRKCGTISITEHFKAWEKAGLKLGKLYEAKLLAEVGAYGVSTSQGYIDYRYASMRMGSGGTSSSSSIAASSSSKASSSSNASSSSSTAASSSSSSAKVQATTCPSANLVTYGSVPANPYTACFKYTGTKSEYLNKCYVCKIDNESGENTCASSWLWNSVANVDDNLGKGYWYKEVTCPATSSSSIAVSSSSNASSSSTAASSSSNASSSSTATSSSSNASSTSNASSSSSTESTPILKNHIPITHFSIQTLSDKSLRIETNSPSVVEIFDLKGNKTTSFDVSSTSQTVKLSLPNGVYFAKVSGMKSVRFVLK